MVIDRMTMQIPLQTKKINTKQGIYYRLKTVKGEGYWRYDNNGCCGSVNTRLELWQCPRTQLFFVAFVAINYYNKSNWNTRIIVLPKMCYRGKKKRKKMPHRSRFTPPLGVFFVVQRRIQNFHLDGAQKITCTHPLYERESGSPFRQGSRARLRVLEPVGVFQLSRANYLSLICKHSDKI